MWCSQAAPATSFCVWAGTEVNQAATVKIHSQPECFQRPDRIRDGKLQPEEMRDYLVQTGDLREGADEARLLREFAVSFEPTRATGYEPAAAKLGREIWALRIGKQPEGRVPGVAISDCHHAREWMTVEVPLSQK